MLFRVTGWKAAANRALREGATVLACSVVGAAIAALLPWSGETRVWIAIVSTCVLIAGVDARRRLRRS